jgi:2-polyprenyl-3-methyl-5-hydroxy-6-metoxy-1,4-benzoquinol methylase
MAFLLARTIMVATKMGILDALADNPRSAEEVAAACGTKPFPTQKVLNALVGARYVRVTSDQQYALAPVARKWLLPGQPGSFRDRVLFQFLEWDIIMRAEEFLRTGEPLDAHSGQDDTLWGLYQRGMRAGLEPLAAEVVQRLKLPRCPTAMLDVGGSHGYWSVAFCRKYPELKATILDLPQAIAHAAPLLAKEGMGNRVVHCAGNALTEELGQDRYDFIFMANLVHHFDNASNLALIQRCAKALKPHGVVAVFEPFRVAPSNAIGQFGGLMDLFFALTSASGTFSPAEIAQWQRAAGLAARKPFRLLVLRDLGVQAAVKTPAN